MSCTTQRRISFEISPSTPTDGSDSRFQVIVDDVTNNGAPATYTYPITFFDPSRDNGDASGQVNWTEHPSIAGTPAVGQTLTLNPGVYSAQVGATTDEQITISWWHMGTNTKVGDGPTYQVTAADAGKHLMARIVVDVYDENHAITTGRNSAVSDKIETAEPTQAPRNTVEPTISGNPAVGSTLNADPGTWSEARSFAYQWFRGANAISGATSRTYRPVSADSGAHLRVRVTGTNAVGSTFAYSASFGPIERRAVEVVNEVPPTLAGGARVGTQLRVTDPGTWSVPLDADTTVTYYWFTNNLHFSNPQPYYRLRPSDLRARIRVAVAVTRDGQQGYIEAGTVGVIRGVAAKPKGRAWYKGNRRVGSTLKGISPNWSPKLKANGIKLRYQWLRNGKVVPGQTSRSYRLTPADRGKNVAFRVKAVWPGHHTGVSTSKANRIR